MPSREAKVEVVAGPGAGRSIAIALGERKVIGRAPDVDLRIPDETVSRAHVELEHRDEGVLVRDVGRAGAARLDGRAIPKGGIFVSLRATLALGGAEIVIARAVPAKRVELPGIELGDEIGRGSAGAVYAARQTPPGRDVAVKVLHDDAEEIHARRLVREAILEAKLDHPSIAKVFDLIENDGVLYVIRELVRGETLEKLVEPDKEKKKRKKKTPPTPLAPERAARIGVDLASALAHAHERGVVHRDVKPANVLIESRGGRAKLVDFGFAKDARAEMTRLTNTADESFGSLHFLSPEQMLGSPHDAEAPTDVYALGGVLYYALSGTRPFSDVDASKHFEKLRTSGPTPLEKIARSVPAPLAAIVARAMAVKPKARPSAAELAVALAPFAR